MYKSNVVCVVIPAYNVENQVIDVLNTIPTWVDQIITVNDCSTDKTLHLAKSVADPRLVVLEHKMNEGVGGAMITGFKQALVDKADLIVKMDGDGQMDPEYLPALLDPLVEENFSYTKGNRFLDNDRLRTMPTYRLFGNYVLTFLTKLVSGCWHIFDPQNGFIAIRAEILQKLNLDHIRKRYFFENDMLIHLNILNARIKDVPIPARYGDENSSMKLSHILVSFPLNLTLRFWHRIYEKYILRDFSPIALFWVFGTVMLLWGMGFGLYTWGRSIILGDVATTGTVMLSVLPFLLGFELTLQGMILEIKENPK